MKTRQKLPRTTTNYHQIRTPSLLLVMRNPDFRICENHDADQLRGNREADQRLYFRHVNSTIPLLTKSEISSLKPFSVIAQPGLCQTWSETPKTGFPTTGLIYKFKNLYYYRQFVSLLSNLSHIQPKLGKHDTVLQVNHMIYNENYHTIEQQQS